jgi:GT2 family glycosyltransferase
MVVVSSPLETQAYHMIKKIAIVILNWNGKKYLESFLPSVCSSTYPNLEIVIGDNGSSDGSVLFLQEEYPFIRVIETGVNLGFTGGYNEVLKAVEADYFILLNSDVEVTPNWVEPLITLMEKDPSIAACQPKIRAYYQKNEFEHAGAAGGFIDKFGYPFCAGRILDTVETDQGQYNSSREIFWASGAALCIKAAAWKKAQGFDRDFFAHMEEIDLCWRLKAMGYKIWYCSESVVYHVGGGTLNKENPFKTYLNFRNNLFMLQKNLPFWRSLFTIFIRFWLDFLALLHFLLQGKRKDAIAVSKAHVNFFRNFKKTVRKRKQIKKTKSISNIYQGSIIWLYFVKRKKKFIELDSNHFS